VRVRPQTIGSGAFVLQEQPAGIIRHARGAIHNRALVRFWKDLRLFRVLMLRRSFAAILRLPGEPAKAGTKEIVMIGRALVLGVIATSFVIAAPPSYAD